MSRRSPLSHAALLLAALSASPARAEEVAPGVPGWNRGFDFRRKGHVGVGLTTGTVLTGPVIKGMLSDRAALQASLGVTSSPFPYWRPLGGAVAIDWLYEPPIIWENDAVRLAWCLGISGSLRMAPTDDGIQGGIGVNAIGGLELLFVRAPVDLTAEYRPGLIAGFGPSAGLGFAYGDIVVSARWWLGRRSATR